MQISKLFKHIIVTTYFLSNIEGKHVLGAQKNNLILIEMVLFEITQYMFDCKRKSITTHWYLAA